jgi:hypothetical protein
MPVVAKILICLLCLLCACLFAFVGIFVGPKLGSVGFSAVCVLGELISFALFFVIAEMRSPK